MISEKVVEAERKDPLAALAKTLEVAILGPCRLDSRPFRDLLVANSLAITCTSESSRRRRLCMRREPCLPLPSHVADPEV
jgi:hypothetical protein